MKRRLGEIGVERGKRRARRKRGQSVALTYSSRVSGNRRVGLPAFRRDDRNIQLNEMYTKKLVNCVGARHVRCRYVSKTVSIYLRFGSRHLCTLRPKFARRLVSTPILVDIRPSLGVSTYPTIGKMERSEAGTRIEICLRRRNSKLTLAKGETRAKRPRRPQPSPAAYPHPRSSPRARSPSAISARDRRATLSKGGQG